MQTIDETRRNRLSILVAIHGSYARLNELLELPVTDAKLNRIANRVPRIDRPGKIFNMGDSIAREIEEKLKLPLGWMDTPPTPAEAFGSNSPQALLADRIGSLSAEECAKVLQVINLMVGAVAETADFAPPPPGTKPKPKPKATV